jgi:hypothetical protein
METREGLNNEDLGLELEINGDLRLSNRGLIKKSGSLGAEAPAAPLWIRPWLHLSSGPSDGEWRQDVDDP